MVAPSRLFAFTEGSLCHENAFLMSLFRTAQTVVDGGATPQTAQRRSHRGRRGQIEIVAERRVLALELRKTGAWSRGIARHSAWTSTRHMPTSGRNLPRSVRRPPAEATELRALELERLDGMTSGMWPQVQKGSPPAVTAAVRVSERRSRLLGLDEPTATRTEISGWLSVDAEARIKAQVEELRDWLSFDELVALGAASDKLFTDALGLAKARRTQMTIDVSSSPVASVDDVMTGESANSRGLPADSDQRDPTRAETTPRETP